MQMAENRRRERNQLYWHGNSSHSGFEIETSNGYLPTVIVSVDG